MKSVVPKHWKVSELATQFGDVIVTDWEGLTDVERIAQHVEKIAQANKWMFEEGTYTCMAATLDITTHIVHGMIEYGDDEMETVVFGEEDPNFQDDRITEIMATVYVLLTCNHWVPTGRFWEVQTRAE